MTKIMVNYRVENREIWLVSQDGYISVEHARYEIVRTMGRRTSVNSRWEYCIIVAAIT